MSRQKCHPSPLKSACHDCVRWIAEWRLHSHLTRIRKSRHGVEPASANDSDANWFLRFFDFLSLDPSRHHSPFTLTGLIDGHRLCFPFAIAFAQICRGHFRIVRKKGNPALLDRFWNPFLFVFQRGHRIEVKSHNPWQSQVSSSGYQVGEEKCCLAAPTQLHALHVRSMSGDTNQFHTWRNGTV